jgi:hypothetical protein
MPALREHQTVHCSAGRDTNWKVAEAGHDGGRRLHRIWESGVLHPAVQLAWVSGCLSGGQDA